MGLDIACADYGFRVGSYRGFGMWRKMLASFVDINLDEMRGFGGHNMWPNKDGLEILLSHSDCDGTISPEEAVRLVKSLKKLRRKLRAGPVMLVNLIKKGTEDMNWFFDRLDEWINVCEVSKRTKENIIFC